MLWLLTALTLAATVHCQNWMTTLDKPFEFACPQGQFLSRMMSAYDGHAHDRRFRFGCTDLYRHERHCSWSGYANAFDKPVKFQCPDNRIMMGIHGIHHNYYEDRRFRFYCCQVEGYVPHDCKFTGYRNIFHGLLDYTVPDGYYMVGIDSFHDNRKEDRMTQFVICRS